MKQRITIITLLLFLFGFSIYAKNPVKRTSVGLFYSISGISIGETEQSSSLSFSIENSSGAGINIVHHLGHTFAIESGVEYTLLDVEQIQITPADTIQTNLSLLQVPILGRFCFSENLFANGGLLLDFDMNSTSAISSQTGMGLMGGIGAIYTFNSGFSIFANPYIKAHSLLRFNSSEQKNSLLEYGIRLGVAYKF